MKKMLMLASVASMIDQFNIPNIEILKKQGNEVHVACNFEKGSTCSAERINELKKLLSKMNVPFFQIDFSRNVLKLNEVLKAYQQVKKLCIQEKYDFIHCHSPIGGVIGRLAGHATNTKVIYTVHGFHFFKGAPLINWLIYYPIEKWLAHYTDVLITINHEDYERAKKFDAGMVEYIPGVGIAINEFEKCDKTRTQYRNQFGIGEQDIMILSVGELNKNKNHKVCIQALGQLNNQKVKYCICGKGDMQEDLKRLAEEENVLEQVKFLGFRKDVSNIYKAADIFVFPSLREGLSVAMMEALASGLPIVCSDIRGNNELVVEGEGGFRINPKNKKEFAKKIKMLVEKKELREKYGKFNEEYIKRFGKDKVNEIMERIYVEL